MPLGTVLAGTSYVVLVGTVNPPATPVGGLKSWDYPTEAPTTTDDFYGQASVITAGAKTGSMTFTCRIELADSGQAILFAAWDSQATIYAMIKKNATDGETLPVKVTNRSLSGADVNNPSDVTFTLGQQAAPIVVGGGFGA